MADKAPTLMWMSSMIIEIIAVLYFISLPHTSASETIKVLNKMPPKSFRREYLKFHEYLMGKRNFGFLVFGAFQMKQTTLIHVSN